jgi:hypothetical protein
MDQAMQLAALLFLPAALAMYFMPEPPETAATSPAPVE